MNKRLILIFLSVMIIISSGCQAFDNDNIFYGTAEMEQISISAETSGVLNEVMVSEGDTINKSTIIASLSVPESTVKYEQASLGIQSAQNELQKVKEGARTEEIAAQRAVVKQIDAQSNAAVIAFRQAEIAMKQAEINSATAKETYEFKKKIYDETLELYKSEAISKQELDTAEYNMNIAWNAYESSIKAAEAAKTQLEIQRAQRESAKQQRESANQKLLMMLNGATSTTKTAAELGIKQAETNYELSQIALNKREIKSELEGVINTINYSVGEFVQQGSTIATVSNPKNMWVKIYVPEKLLPQLKLKQEVLISTKLIKEQIKGTISNISSEAEFTPMNVITKEDRERLVYAVKIQITKPTEKLKAGMLLDVQLK